MFNLSFFFFVFYNLACARVCVFVFKCHADVIQWAGKWKYLSTPPQQSRSTTNFSLSRRIDTVTPLGKLIDHLPSVAPHILVSRLPLSVNERYLLVYIREMCVIYIHIKHRRARFFSFIFIFFFFLVSSPIHNNNNNIII